MNQKGQIGGVAVFVTLFVGIVVTIALFSASADQVGLMTNKQTSSNESVLAITAFVDANNVNESINITMYEQSEWKRADCPLSSVAVRNGAGTALVLDTDYTLYTDYGVFSLLNTSKTVPATSLNTTYVDYTYCADGYNKDASSRSMAGLVITLSALALMAFALDKSGVINLFGR